MDKCCSKKCLSHLTNHGSIANMNYVNRLQLDLLNNVDDSELDAHVKQILQRKFSYLSFLFLFM